MFALPKKLKNHYSEHKRTANKQAEWILTFWLMRKHCTTDHKPWNLPKELLKWSVIPFVIKFKTAGSTVYKSVLYEWVLQVVLLSNCKPTITSIESSLFCPVLGGIGNSCSAIKIRRQKFSVKITNSDCILEFFRLCLFVKVCSALSVLKIINTQIGSYFSIQLFAHVALDVFGMKTDRLMEMLVDMQMTWTQNASLTSVSIGFRLMDRTLDAGGIKKINLHEDTRAYYISQCSLIELPIIIEKNETVEKIGRILVFYKELANKQSKYYQSIRGKIKLSTSYNRKCSSS